MIAKEPFYEDFVQSLAKVGESGTAKNLLPNLPSNVSISLKTGTLDGVKAYAGYIKAANGDLLSFAIISNNYECPAKTVADKMARILLKMATIY